MAEKTVQVSSDNVTIMAFIEHMRNPRERVRRDSSRHSSSSNGLENYLKSQARFQETELEIRPIVETRFNIRMDVASEFVSNDRQFLGAETHRPIRVHDDNPARDILLSVLGSIHIRSGCIRAERLDNVTPPLADLIQNQKVYWPGQAWFQKLLAMVIHTPVRRPIKQNSFPGRTQDGALKEQGLGNLRREGFWRSRLRCLGWTKHAATRTVNSLADSTLRSYNMYTNNTHFCNQKQTDLFN